VIDCSNLVEAVDVTLTKENPPMGANCGGAGVELHLINNKTAD
jgi:dihydroneopterin aldolase